MRKFKLGPTYGGLNTALAPHVLEDGASPRMDGFIGRLEGAETAKGWAKFTSQQLTDGEASPADLTVLAIKEFNLRNGAFYLVAITNKRAYYFEETSDLWLPITRGSQASTTVDDDSAAAQKVLSVAATTGYTVGDTVIVGEGTAREEECVVDSISAGVSLTMLANLAYEHTAVQADPVRRTYAAAIVDDDSAAAQKVLSVSHTDQFTAGEAVIIGMGTSRVEYGIIDTISAGASITLVANLTYAHTAVQADKVHRVSGLNFTVEATEVDIAIDNDKFYWTDGVNPVQVWDATGTPTYAEDLAGLGAGDDVEGIAAPLTVALKAKYIRFFEGFCMLGHTTEEGNAAPQRVRWSKYGDPTVWVNDVDGLGQAGYFTFIGPDFIMRLEQLKREILVYRETTVEGGTYLGPPDYFAWRRVATGVGLISHEGLAPVLNQGGGVDAHFCVSKEEVFWIDGMSTQPIGTDVNETLFDELTPTYKGNVLVFYDDIADEAMVCLPTGDTRLSTKAYVYSTLFKKWVGTRTVSASAWGTYEEQATTTWDGASGTWDDYTSTWDSREFLANAPMILFGDTSGYVYQLNADVDQEGSTWNRDYYTKLTDLGGSEMSKRVMEIRLGLRREGAGTINVYLGKAESEGDDLTWTDPVVVSLAGDTHGYAMFDETAKFFQVRVETSVLCNIRTIEVGFIPREDIRDLG